MSRLLQKAVINFFHSILETAELITTAIGRTAFWKPETEIKDLTTEFKSYFDCSHYENAFRVDRQIVTARKKISKDDLATITAQHSLGSALFHVGGPGNLKGTKTHLKESWDGRKVQ